MSSSSLERVQQDLDLMKASLQADFPYDRGSVGMSTSAAICGMLFALRAIPGWDGVMSGVLLTVIAGLVVVWGVWLRSARTDRVARPNRWSWARLEVVSGTVAILGLIGYALLMRLTTAGEAGWNFGAWRNQLAGPALFAFGVGMLVIGIVRSERRSYLGWSLALIATGLAMPWIASRTEFWAIGGSAMALGGAVSTVIMWRQLCRWEAVDGPN